VGAVGEGPLTDRPFGEEIERLVALDEPATA
jgi:hypothetical protein